MARRSPEAVRVAIGGRLKAAREHAGLSQKEAAGHLKLAAPSTLAEWEQGRSRVPVDMLPEMGRLYRTTPDALVLGTNLAPSDVPAPVEDEMLMRAETLLRTIYFTKKPTSREWITVSTLLEMFAPPSSDGPGISVISVPPKRRNPSRDNRPDRSKEEP